MPPSKKIEELWTSFPLFVLKAKNEEYFKIGIDKQANTIQLGLFPYGCVFSFVGHDANSFYFILSGSVIVERMEEDKSTGEQHKQVRSYKQLSGVYRECWFAICGKLLSSVFS